MVQRLTYRRRLSYNTKSNRKRMWVARRVNVTFYYDRFFLPLKLKWTVNIILIYLFCSLFSLSAAPRLLVSLFWIFISFVTRANCGIVFRWLRKDRRIFFCWNEKSVFWRVFLKYCFFDVSLHCQSIWGVVSLTALYIFCRAWSCCLIVRVRMPHRFHLVLKTSVTPPSFLFKAISIRQHNHLFLFSSSHILFCCFSISLPIYVQLILFLRRKVGLLVHKEARQGSKMWRLPKETPRSE